MFHFKNEYTPLSKSSKNRNRVQICGLGIVYSQPKF